MNTLIYQLGTLVNLNLLNQIFTCIIFCLPKDWRSIDHWLTLYTKSKNKNVAHGKFKLLFFFCRPASQSTISNVDLKKGWTRRTERQWSGKAESPGRKAMKSHGFPQHWLHLISLRGEMRGCMRVQVQMWVYHICVNKYTCSQPNKWCDHLVWNHPTPLKIEY